MAKQTFSGAMVGHFLPPYAAHALALSPSHVGVASTPEASAQETLEALGIALQEPESLHLTLAFLGQASALEEGATDQIRAAVQSVAAHRGDYLTATVSGLARFTNTPPGEPHVLVALLDVPWLSWLYTDLLTALYKQGIHPDTSTHGFTPHVTLAYIRPDVATPPLTLPPVSWPLSTLTVGLGGDYEHFPLGATESVVIETQPESRSATPSHLLLDDLVSWLVRAYSWNQEQVQELARSIYLARLDTYTASYRAQVEALGGSLAQTWQPTPAILRQMAQDALTAADQIAATQARDLETAVLGIVHGYLVNAPAVTNAETMRRQLATAVSNWVQGRADWKTAQIAQHETVRAANQATTDLYRHLTQPATQGATTPQDGEDLGDSPDSLNLSGIDPSLVIIQIDPGDSSADGCAAFAGNSYPLEEWDNIPAFPMHINCIHVKYLAYDASAAQDTQDTSDLADA